jgi:DNA-binding MarR family transcriptional regulator
VTTRRNRPDEKLVEQIERDLADIRRALRVPLETEIAHGGLTPPQLAVMQALVRSDAMSLKELSRVVGLAHSTVSGIVDRLESKGLLERRTDPADGRVTRIYPTDAVKEFVAEQLPKLSERPLERALRRASRAERAQIGATIRRLRELLDEASSRLASETTPQR